VVLSLLTLFAIVGITFVLYADSEATAARVARESETAQRADVDPELAFSYFLGQLLYDCLDDESGVYSALRGHSLLRNLYGLNTTVNMTTGAVTLTTNNPFDGTGRLHWNHDSNATAAPWSHPKLNGIDDFYLINYQYFPEDG